MKFPMYAFHFFNDSILSVWSDLDDVGGSFSTSPPSYIPASICGETLYANSGETWEQVMFLLISNIVA